MTHSWVGQLWVAEWQLARDETKRLHSPKLLGRGHVSRRKNLFFASMVKVASSPGFEPAEPLYWNTLKLDLVSLLLQKNSLFNDLNSLFL
jgi:hypothetical protein